MIHSELTDVASYDNPATFPVDGETLAIFRREWCRLGSRHALIDRWRFDLRWSIAPEVCRAFLEADRRTFH